MTEDDGPGNRAGQVGRRSRAILVLCLAGAAWYLFGYTVVEPTPRAAALLHRSFGRVLRVDLYGVGDRRPAERWIYRWSRPYEEGCYTPCEFLPAERWEDRNRDGRWDTWRYNLGNAPGGGCSERFEVDTLGTGAPDWTFVASTFDYEQTNTAIRARLGD